MPASKDATLVLLTGATGYVGGRLLQALEQRKEIRLRCLARHPEYLTGRVSASTDVAQGDLLDSSGLDEALRGVRAAYYLVHSMGAVGSFEENDRRAAENFSKAAKTAGVRRIIYLGGLADPRETLSAHLRSRLEVGEILRSSGIPVLEFRASIVIGSGSLSFELIRALVERLPVMLTPRWVSMPAQPIAVEDLIAYLSAALDTPLAASRIFEIGGADRVSYADLMRAYALRRGKRLVMIPIPFLTPYLSSLWLGLVTPLYARIGRKLVESVVHSTVVSDHSALTVFNIRPTGMDEAVERALVNEDREFAATRWSDALSSAGEKHSWGGLRFGSRLVDSRSVTVPVSPVQAFAPIQGIGGARGWYAWDLLWHLRGFIDLMAGGVGMRRGRPLSNKLRPGDALDFWRVEAFEPDHILRLVAEMRVPGRAWLEFEVTGNETSSTIRQTAMFDPVGLTGLVYWYGLWPVHQLVFQGMLNGIARATRG